MSIKNDKPVSKMTHDEYMQMKREWAQFLQDKKNGVERLDPCEECDRPANLVEGDCGWLCAECLEEEISHPYIEIDDRERFTPSEPASDYEFEYKD